MQKRAKLARRAARIFVVAALILAWKLGGSDKDVASCGACTGGDNYVAAGWVSAATAESPTG